MVDQPLVPQHLIQVFNWFDRNMLARMTALGWPQLSRSQSMVMAYVTPEGIRLSEIARRQFVSRQAIHQLVKELGDLGLLELVPDPLNRSAKLVRATTAGVQCIADAKAIFSTLEAELSVQMGLANFDSLRALLASAQAATKGS